VNLFGVLSPIEGLVGVTSKNTPFEVLPLGSTTVTEAVLALAISVAKILAFNCERFTKVVVRGLPFHFTTEPEINPVPFTVSVKPTPPGVAVSGIKGWLTRGTGFWPTATQVIASDISDRLTMTNAKAPINLVRICFVITHLLRWLSRASLTRLRGISEEKWTFLPRLVYSVENRSRILLPCSG
jgi:hypothetical protein